MSVRSEILFWAQRVMAKKGAPPHAILELAIDAGIEDAQAAFHKIARMAHPDLHRASLTPDELELVTSAYSRVAAAYQDFRGQRVQTTRMRPVRDGALPSGPDAAAPPVAGASAATAMSAKALIYYRKAELCLRRGDLRGAVLQLKMAIATDPHSPLLRSALIEVEVEVGKKP